MAYLGGLWYLGPGDSSPEIRNIKKFMRAMYRSYAGQLADTEAYDAQMTSVVFIMQGKLRDSGKLPADKVNGYIGNSTKVAMGYLKAPPGPDIRPVLFTVSGTSVPWWIGPDADTAKALPNNYLWQPIGPPYTADAVPMGPSIARGRTELINQFNRLRAQVERNGAVLAGYSQGACVVSEVWENDIKPQTGVLHWAKNHILKAVTWGNPSREVGKAYNDGVSLALPNTGGVTGTRMVDTPDWWRNYAHAGDLYASGYTGDNAASQDKEAIWKLIRGGGLKASLGGANSLLSQFLEITQAPIPGAIGAFTAMWDAGKFFGTQTRDHVNYNIGPAIDYLRY